MRWLMIESSVSPIPSELSLSAAHHELTPDSGSEGARRLITRYVAQVIKRGRYRSTIRSPLWNSPRKHSDS
jgi:hypothetical protein